jgi:hypothetical protein
MTPRGSEHVLIECFTDLIKTAICLGRAPGFRKAEVERAFKDAILQAF